MNKFIKIFFILLALLVSGFLIYLFVNANAKYTVLRVLDGDTVYIDFNNNGIAEKNEKKGLSDIVAFETRPGYRLNNQIKDYDLMQQEVLELGYLAKDLLEKKVLNKKVKVKFINKKKYYALLYLNGELVQDSLIESGYVVPYKRSRRYHYDEELIQKARKQLKGRDLKAKPYEQETQAHEEKVSEKPIPDVHTEFIDLYFIDPTKYDKPAKYCRTSACQALLREINNAKQSIDFAIYGISRQPEIFNALIEAKKRGIKVRGVTDADKYNKNIYSDTEFLSNNLGKDVLKTDFLTTKRLETLKDQYLTDKRAKGNFKGNPEYAKYIIEGREVSVKTVSEAPLPIQEGIMHNKYFIFDKKTVCTGSTNISSSGTGGYNSNVVACVKSNDIASLYLQDFNQMHDLELFSKWKTSNFNNRKVKLNDDTAMLVYFCPQDNPLYEGLKPIIESAKKYIYIMAFYFTDSSMTQYLINARERGVDVELILDANGAANSYSKHHILRQAGIKVKVENFGGKMHMKSMVIDDEIFVLGSMNFTKTARTKNNENINIIWNKKGAESFKKYFVHLWDKLPDESLYGEIKPESPKSINSCSDGLDNDHDGYFDMKDYDCR